MAELSSRSASLHEAVQEGLSYPVMIWPSSEKLQGLKNKTKVLPKGQRICVRTSTSAPARGFLGQQAAVRFLIASQSIVTQRIPWSSSQALSHPCTKSSWYPHTCVHYFMVWMTCAVSIPHILLSYIWFFSIVSMGSVVKCIFIHYI